MHYNDNAEYMNENNLYPNQGITQFGHRYSVIYKISTKFEISSIDDLLSCKNAYLEKDYIRLYMSLNAAEYLSKYNVSTQFIANIVKLAGNRKLWIESEKYDLIWPTSLMFMNKLN